MRQLVGLIAAVASAAVVLATVARADVIVHGGTEINMDLVVVAAPGGVANPADTTGDPNPCGSVGYDYRIGKYE